MIEDFDLKYKDLFNEEDCHKRWDSLLKIYSEDFNSFRVLFMIEVLACLDKWKEPSAEDLKRLLNLYVGGKRFGIRIGRIIDLFQSVWPLEMAKQDILLLKTFSEKYTQKKYFLTFIKLASTALVQAWWAFETQMNDFASIILEHRRESLSDIQKLFLEDKSCALNQKGQIEERTTYQSIDSRIQFIYNILTKENIDRSSTDWENLMGLKNSRDIYIHRLGKETKTNFRLADTTLIFDGFKSVQKIIGDVFEKTPEFSERYVYKFLAFWSCKNDMPFLWDGKEGSSLYLGVASFEPERILDLFTPQPSSFVSFIEEDGG